MWVYFQQGLMNKVGMSGCAQGWEVRPAGETCLFLLMLTTVKGDIIPFIWFVLP